MCQILELDRMRAERELLDVWLLRTSTGPLSEQHTLLNAESSLTLDSVKIAQIRL